MRLAILDRGHTLGTKVLFSVIRLLSRVPVPDVVKTLKYRPEFFGGLMSPVFQEVMRGPSPWPVGERELMAAYVSRINACQF